MFLVPPEDSEFAAILAKDREPYRALSEQVEEITELFRGRLAEGRIFL